MKSSVLAIIVNWNGKNDTMQCLASLKDARKKNPFLSVLVIDNGSSDGSVEAMKKKYAWVRYICLEKNLGFSGANNVGIEYAQKEHIPYIWLLNNDTVVNPSTADAVRVFDDPLVGGVGSKIYFYKGCEFHKNQYTPDEQGKVLWYAGGIIDWQNMLAFHRGVDEVDHGQYDSIVETDYITGCSFFIRTDVTKKIGFFDESYFMYMEDLDYSLRIQKAGWKTLYDPCSVVYHKNAASSGGSGSKFHEYYQTRNRLLVAMKYAPFKTKAALVREAFVRYWSWPDVKKKAVMDALFGKYGNQYV